jgi:hypothetical protein
MNLIRSTLLSVFLGTCAIPALTPSSQAQIVISVELPPPPLPVYEQPPIPGPEWLWTPGYWAYDDDFGYYWVPGTWVQAPRPGLLWTPGYWAFENGVYRYFAGYWADRVGFYGGVDYGYGYTGSDYEGGHWEGEHFFYNRTVNNITGVNITNVYSKTVIVNNGPRVSYNGGQGGLNLRPTPEQVAVTHEQHVEPTAVQREHIQTASQNPALRETQNKGKPPVAATQRPNDFKGQGVVSAQSAGERPAGQTIPNGRKNPAAAPIGAETPRSEQPAQPQRTPAVEPKEQQPNAKGNERSEPNKPRPPVEAPKAPVEPPKAPPETRQPQRGPQNEPDRMAPTPRSNEAPRAEPEHSEPRAEPPKPRPEPQVRPQAEPPHPPGPPQKREEGKPEERPK